MRVLARSIFGDGVVVNSQLSGAVLRICWTECEEEDAAMKARSWQVFGKKRDHGVLELSSSLRNEEIQAHMPIGEKQLKTLGCPGERRCSNLTTNCESKKQIVECFPFADNCNSDCDKG